MPPTTRSPCPRRSGFPRDRRALAATGACSSLTEPRESMSEPDHQVPERVLGEPTTEEFIGTKDLTRWSRLGQGLARLAIRTSRYVSAHTVLVISAALGLLLVCGLTAISAEIYDNVKDQDDLAGL